MKNIALAIIVLILTASCDSSGPESTETQSHRFNSLEEKVEFLNRYVKFRRTYHELDFDILFRNGGGGMLPSPSEWDIKIVAVVPKSELGLWSSGLSPAQAFDPDWINSVRLHNSNIEFSSWYREAGIEVAVDEKNSLVAYRNQAQ